MLSTVQQSVLASLVSRGISFAAAERAVTEASSSRISFDEFLRNALASLGADREREAA
jgi:hypothetical protein